MDPTLIFNLIMGLISSIPGSINGNPLSNESLIPASDVSTPNFANSPPPESSLLHEKVERLALVNAAMWSLLSEKLGVTTDDLIAKIREIDLADGRSDGKISSTAKNCPKCNRILNSSTGNCLYCGYTPSPTDQSIEIASGNMRVIDKENEPAS
jgi:hypothetical protein